MLKNLRNGLARYEMLIAGLIIVIILTGFAYLIYSYHTLAQEKISNLELISELNTEQAELIVQVREREAVINAFQGQIQDIGTTVGDLKKLSETDKELLMKYSKVFFLNENYAPSRLTYIDEKYLLEPERELFIHTDIWPFLQKLIDDAKRESVDLLIASAYRSFDTQESLKNGYTFTYGSRANKFSADQGYSEHQLGTTVDFTTLTLGASFSKFGVSKTYEWLQENAYKYGFILSYPDGNAYYKYEPWHWRFVGKSLAKTLKEENKNFYDLDQREIDKYLINIFDE